MRAAKYGSIPNPHCSESCPGNSIPSLHPLPIELRLRSFSENFQCALIARCVRADEYPVLPGGKPPENLRQQIFVSAKSQTRLHSSQSIRRKVYSFFNSNSNLIFPIQILRRNRNKFTP